MRGFEIQKNMPFRVKSVSKPCSGLDIFERYLITRIRNMRAKVLVLETGEKDMEVFWDINKISIIK